MTMYSLICLSMLVQSSCTKEANVYMHNYARAVKIWEGDSTSWQVYSHRLLAQCQRYLLASKLIDSLSCLRMWSIGSKFMENLSSMYMYIHVQVYQHPKRNMDTHTRWGNNNSVTYKSLRELKEHVGITSQYTS